MPFKIVVNGVEISADTAREALALAKEYAPKEAAPSAPKPSRPIVQPAAPVRTPPATSLFTPEQAPRPLVGKAALTAAILNKIGESGPAGASVAVLNPLVGGGNELGFGAKLRPVKTFITELGFAVEDVYRTERVNNKASWFAGPKLDEALERASSLAGLK